MPTNHHRRGLRSMITDRMSQALSPDDKRQLKEELEQGYTLPANWYTNADMFRLEQRRMFRHSWQYAGLMEQVAAPGDFFTYQTGDLSVIILRDKQEQLHAFVNVCRHRGSQLLLQDKGQCS